LLNIYVASISNDPWEVLGFTMSEQF
jgi:hypothetical protein